MNVPKIFLDIYTMRLLECKDIIDYTSWYQIAFDKLFSLLSNNSWISKKTIKMILQGSLLRYLGTDYLALILAIEII